MADEFTDALERAFCGPAWQPYMGLYPNQRRAILAVARVALHRAAAWHDQRLKEWEGVYRGMAIFDERIVPVAAKMDAHRESAAAIRALIPPEETT